MMFRELIEQRLAELDWTPRKASVLAEVHTTSFKLYLKGGTAIGLTSVEALFRTLGINVVDGEGKFYWHGYDLHTAVKRGMTEQKMLVKDMCGHCGMTQPNLTEFLAGRAQSRPAKVEAMLSALGMSVAAVEPPQRMPRLKTGRKKKITFQIGCLIRQALDGKGMTPYAFSHTYNIHKSAFPSFLTTGKGISMGKLVQILNILNFVVVDEDGVEYPCDSIREAVRKTMQKKGVTYAALAEAVGCSSIMMTFFATGRNETSAIKLDAIFTTLGLTLAEKTI